MFVKFFNLDRRKIERESPFYFSLFQIGTFKNIIEPQKLKILKLWLAIHILFSIPVFLNSEINILDFFRARMNRAVRVSRRLSCLLVRKQQ